MSINPPGYYGARVPGCTSLTGAITLDRASGTVTAECPAMVYAHAGVNSSGTGISFPWDEVEYRWDFGDDTATQAITHPVHGASVDLDTCQVGPNAAFAYTTAGVKTITCTPRVLRSGSGTVADPWVWVNGTAVTATFTVTAWSGTDFYFDSVGGTAGGTGTIGDPSSSESQLRTWLRAGSNRRALIKRGSTFTLTTYWEIGASTNAARTGQRIEAYGSGADPIVIAGFSGVQLLYTNLNNAALTVSDFVCSGIVFDGNATITRVIYLLSSTGQLSNINFYKCTFKNPNTSDGSKPLQMSTDLATGASSIRFWRTTFDGDTTAEMGTLFEGNSNYYCWVGCNFLGGGTGAGVNSSTDHYMYISKCSHVLLSHMDFNETAGNYNYCANINTYTTSSGGAVTGDYTHVVDCDCSGVRNGFDDSPTNNNPNTGRFGNTLIQKNCAHGLGDMFDTTISNSSFVLYYGCKRMTIRRNLMWGNIPTSGNGSSLIRIAEDVGKELAAGLTVTLNVYENEIQLPVGLGSNLTWLEQDNLANVTLGGDVRDNVIVDERTTTRAVRVAFAKSTQTWANNDFYSPNDAIPDFNNKTSSTGSNETEATFELTFGSAAFDVFNTSNPSWSSPSTGLFTLKSVRCIGHTDTIEYADNTSVTAYGSPYVQSTSQVQTFRLYNGSPNQVLILTSGGISIAGDATISTNPATAGAVTLPPGTYATLGLTLTTSSGGSKTFTCTIVSDEAGTPFLLVNGFTVTSIAASGGFFDILGLTVHWMAGIDYAVFIVRTGRTNIVGGDGVRTLTVGGDGGRTTISHSP